MYIQAEIHSTLRKNIPGPLSVDRFPEVDDDVDVDVEQCSDSEAHLRSRAPRTASHNSRATPPSDEERLTPEPVRKKVNSKSKLTENIFLIHIFLYYHRDFQLRIVHKSLDRVIPMISGQSSVI